MMRMNSRRTAIVTATFPGGGAVAVPAPPNVTDSGWREGYSHQPSALSMIYPPIGYRRPTAASAYCPPFAPH
jgi:hypothetical protein